ncbi:MAG: InlB B-repeat-containing protein, partial [Erysipelotrichaceae bacterium]|nr:InlB B-repeat-containing protein [Erysipelotrichaceae bacterium]
TDENCTNLFEFSGTLTNDITLYAKWISYSAYDTISVGSSYYGYFYSKSSANARYLAFVPLVSESIRIYTDEGFDTYGYLCNSNKSTLTYNDNGGNGNNFSITYSVTAGQLYYIKPTGYNSNYYMRVYISGTSTPASTLSGSRIVGVDLRPEASPLTQKVTFDSQYTVHTPTINGYTFNGWKYNGETFANSGIYRVDNDIDLLIDLSLNTYSITYHLNGGTTDETIVNTYTIESSNVLLPTLTKPNYNFIGWYDTAEFEGSPITSIPNGSFGNKEFYAKFMGKKYTVTYDINATTEITVTYNYNCSDYDDSSYIYEFGDTIPYPSIPTRTDYIFAGWYTDESLTTPFNFSGTINEDITLYAKWQNYSAYGYFTLGNSFSGTHYGTASSTKRYYAFVPLVSETIEFYDNNSYTLQYNLYDKDFNVLQTNLDRLTYDVTAGELYYIRVCRNGTSSSTSGNIYTIGTSTISSTLLVTCDTGFTTITTSDEFEYGNSYTLWNLERNGYTFNGWYKDGVLYPMSGTFTETGNITLVASYTLNTYTISYSDNGGTTSDERVTSYTINDLTFNLPVMSKVGYVFEGWCKEADYSDTPITSITMGSYGNLQLYAKFTPITYTIEYDFDGGVTDSEIVYEYTIESETITLPTLTKEHYTFNGWFTNPELTISCSSIPQGSIEDKVFYAKFTPVEYTISYTDNGGTTIATKPATYNVETETFYLPVMEKTGYTFNGWYTTSDFSDEPITLISQGSYGNINLYAKFTVNTYTISYDIGYSTNAIVTFDKNYEGSIDSTVELTQGDNLDYPSIPTRSGYLFAGWYLDKDCSTLFDFEGTISTDLTLYAKWNEVNPSAYGTYYVGSNNYIELISQSSSPRYYAFVPLVSETIEIYSTGSYDSIGFLYDSNLSQLISNDDGGNNSNFKITYAVTAGEIYYFRACAYSSSYSSYVYINGTSTPESTLQAELNVVKSVDVVYGTEYSLWVPSNQGYVFSHWTKDGVIVPNTGTFLYDEDITLVAVRTPINYNITYYLNGGIIEDLYSTTYNYESSFTLPIPTKTGYTFNGWYD